MKKIRPGFNDPKGIIMEGFAGGAIICEGSVLPAQNTAGYRPGCLFFKRDATGGPVAGLYRNGGTYTQCNFGASPFVLLADAKSAEPPALEHKEEEHKIVEHEEEHKAPEHEEEHEEHDKGKKGRKRFF